MVLTLVAGALVAGCGTAAPVPKTAVSRSPSAVVTLPDLAGSAKDVRILVPSTRGRGARAFNGGVFTGKPLFIEIACLHGSYTVAYKGGSLRANCDGKLETIDDEAAAFRVGRPTKFRVYTNGEWIFRVTEQK